MQLYDMLRVLKILYEIIGKYLSYTTFVVCHTGRWKYDEHDMGQQALVQPTNSPLQLSLTVH